ncbi:hypothetical protein EJ08DRAFT_659637 [Tothia fuscella]|uniref:Ankryin n=1 Tax=Tothia fuscella TaxID=1048955 RepID=A0A9P4TZ05_9PEZI|nr:hypothetical protein EJ08DRAFT_659637 [Tothia fuscella]
MKPKSTHNALIVQRLSRAARVGRTNIVELLLQHGADVDLESLRETTAIIGAAGSRNVNMVELLLKSGAGVCWIGSASYRWQTQDGTALDIAMGNEDEVMIELLRREGGKTLMN